MIPTPSLFLGFLQTSCMQEAFQKASPALVTLFTGGGDYLERRFDGEKSYLGKQCHAFPTLQELEDLEANITSLIQRLAPHLHLKNESYLLILQ